MEIEITVEQIEALAAKLEADEDARREKLLRLIKAYSRILSIREPEAFQARATEYRDQAHWDSSYPPEGEYVGRTGPRTIHVRDFASEEVPTSPGFYYEWKLVPTDPGLYVDARGRFWGGAESGTGRVGQFAAHPGDCDRDVTIEWELRSDVSTAELVAAELQLRGLTFPASAKTSTAQA